MKKKKLLFPILVFLLIPTYAHSYIDLGSLTIFFQLIVAGIIGSLLTIKLWWSLFINFFKKFKRIFFLTNNDIDQDETKR